MDNNGNDSDSDYIFLTSGKRFRCRGTSYFFAKLHQVKQPQRHLSRLHFCSSAHQLRDPLPSFWILSLNSTVMPICLWWVVYEINLESYFMSPKKFRKGGGCSAIHHTHTPIRRSPRLLLRSSSEFYRTLRRSLVSRTTTHHTPHTNIVQHQTSPSLMSTISR